jgi:penicillin-binding protein 1A
MTWCRVRCATGLVVALAALATYPLSVGVASMADGLTLAPAPQATIVYDASDRQVFTFFRERRTNVPLDRISADMKAAVLAIEDRRFFQHHGVDFIRVAGSAWADLRARRIVEGGSTITQQLVRLNALSPRRTFRRKIRELMLAVALEHKFPKSSILAAYLNRVYFGDGYYGIEAAARGYFGKPAADLTALESATLAGLIKSPKGYAPREAPERAKARRNRVLRAMQDAGYLSAENARELQQAALVVQPRSAEDLPIDDASQEPAFGGLYFKEEIRRQLVKQFGVDEVYQGGLRVYSTLSPEMQRAAEGAVTERIRSLEASKSFRKNSQSGPLQTGLVAIDPMNGYVQALVGGRDFEDSPFDRAIQARRQPGSAFKPLLFAAAIERGYAPGTMIDTATDAAVGTSGSWRPRDHGDDRGDPQRYTLRRALTVSSNRAAAQLIDTVGVAATLDLAKRAGIASPLPAVPSLALGTGEVTLLELTSAYSAFANGGVRAEPTFIRRVESPAGEVVWQPRVRTLRAVSPETAFLVSSMLSDVIQRGTASKARAMGFSLPAAGKTGTTDDYKDAWFIGYTPHLAAGVWFGFDAPSKIMNEGFAATVAVPAWAEFMKRATADSKRDAFPQPADIQRVTLCRASGQLATDQCRLAATAAQLPPESIGLSAVPTEQRPPDPLIYDDYVVAGTVGPCPVHGGTAGRLPVR